MSLQCGITDIKDCNLSDEMYDFIATKSSFGEWHGQMKFWEERDHPQIMPTWVAPFHYLDWKVCFDWNKNSYGCARGLSCRQIHKCFLCGSGRHGLFNLHEDTRYKKCQTLVKLEEEAKGLGRSLDDM